jgi:hypothetical protein
MACNLQVCTSRLGLTWAVPDDAFVVNCTRTSRCASSVTGSQPDDDQPARTGRRPICRSICRVQLPDRGRTGTEANRDVVRCAAGVSQSHGRCRVPDRSIEAWTWMRRSPVRAGVTSATRSSTKHHFMGVLSDFYPARSRPGRRGVALRGVRVSGETMTQNIVMYVCFNTSQIKSVYALLEETKFFSSS